MRKLTLSLETLRVLDEDDLTQVVGGTGGSSDSCKDKKKKKKKEKKGSQGKGVGNPFSKPPGCVSK